MNFKNILSIAIVAMPFLATAQQEITITEGDKQMSTATKNCYVMLIPQAKAKDVTEEWKKQMKKDAKAKPEEKNGEIQMVGAVNKNISAAPLVITAQFTGTTDGTQVSAWFSDGDYISTAATPDKSAAVQKFLHDFGVQQYKLAVKNQLDAETKTLKQLENVYDGYVKDQKKAESNILNHQKEIDHLTNDITKEQNKGANAQGNDNVSKLDADKAKLKSDQNVAKDKRDIEKNNTKIQEEQVNIEKAKANQVAARATADKQKDVVKQISDVLNNIK